MTSMEPIKRTNKIIQVYYEELKKGKRRTEAIKFCEDTIKEVRGVIEGTSRKGLSSMVDLMTGRKQVALTDERTISRLEETINRLFVLEDTAKLYSDCDHDWKIISYFSGLGSSWDVQCTECDSVITTHDFELLIRPVILSTPQPDREYLVAEIGLVETKYGINDSHTWMKKDSIIRKYIKDNDIPHERITRNLVHDRGL